MGLRNEKTPEQISTLRLLLYTYYYNGVIRCLRDSDLLNETLAEL